MADVANKEEYLARFKANQKIEGYGADVVTICPCPFCAAAEFKRLPLLTTREAMQEDATCAECGRSAKAIFTDTPGGGYIFEYVQTGGPDQPDYIEPKMRRIDR